MMQSSTNQELFLKVTKDQKIFRKLRKYHSTDHC